VSMRGGRSTALVSCGARQCPGPHLAPRRQACVRLCRVGDQLSVDGSESRRLRQRMASGRTPVRAKSSSSREGMRLIHVRFNGRVGTVRSESRFAGVVAYHLGRVVLVREEYSGWGGAFWNIPSGRIEDHETPCQGASRELAEETGLIVPPADLYLHSTCEVAGTDKINRAWNFTVDVGNPTLRVRDPDGVIQEARWFPADEAARLLRALPYRPLSEPSVALLTGHVASGAHWAYTSAAEDPVVSLSGN
jgi:8-oxo-dGTP diphosphatase